MPFLNQSCAYLAVLEGHDLVAGAVDDEEGRLDVRYAVDVGEDVPAEREAQGQGHAVDREDGALGISGWVGGRVGGSWEGITWERQHGRPHTPLNLYYDNSPGE